MPEDLFATAWARHERADALRKRMIELWGTYLDTHPFDFSFDEEGDGVYILRVWQNDPAPAELGVVTGECFYNFRSTLDYVIWATAAHETGSAPPPDEQALQFPIYDSKQGWDRNLYRLKHLAEHHRSMLLAMQPFNSDVDANYLGWINRLARIDRHRHLNHITGRLAEIDPVIAAPEGCGTTLQWGDRVLRDGHADVARVTVSPWHEGMDVQINPRIGIDPEIAAWSQSPFWAKIRFSERLRMIHIFVAGEIATYEYDCAGHSRYERLLTEDYKAECDLRHTSGKKHPKRQRSSSVEWSEPRAGRPSTEERFKGEDFPPHGPEQVGD